jgi:NAD(P)-dependent dehydrogenase (short-subunit alcohol dehydrogenase family)
MSPRVVVVTGASDGIGAAATRQLARNGDRVVVVGRSPEKTAAIASELGADSFLADFARLDDVRMLAARLLEAYPRIDILANNAGGIMGDRSETVDGHEKTFQVNHLGPFLLTTLLLDRLRESGARVINTSSVANKAYGDSKLANILFTRELSRRFSAEGITTAAFHPGGVATNFSVGSTSPMRFVYGTALKRVLISPEKGADTLIWLASTRPDEDWVSGEYYTKRKISRANAQAYDADLARELWDRSAAMIG